MRNILRETMRWMATVPAHDLTRRNAPRLAGAARCWSAAAAETGFTPPPPPLPATVAPLTAPRGHRLK